MNKTLKKKMGGVFLLVYAVWYIYLMVIVLSTKVTLGLPLWLEILLVISVGILIAYHIKGRRFWFAAIMGSILIFLLISLMFSII